MGNIRLTGVKKNFGEVTVIHDMNLEISEGEFVVFVGPSGCGKSSLLRLITGLEEVTAGKIEIDGTDVTDKEPADRRLAMVFQSYALYPHMSVRDNMAFGLKIAGESREAITRKVDEVARILELTVFLDRRPKELSGGQRQRVAIGRAIVRSPVAFLFDEPLSNLDASLRVQMRIELIKLHRQLAKTMVYVTHDQTEAMTMADRIVVLNKGRIEQFDTPIALYDRPANLFVAGFIGSPKMNFVPVASGAGDVLQFPGGTSLMVSRMPGTVKTLGIRPEHIGYSATDGLWRGVVTVKEQLGSDAFFYVDVPEIGSVTVRAVGERGFEVGQPIHLSPLTGQVHLFDPVDQAIARSPTSRT
jgi:multiple sugar transport system ATP-binding protein